MNQADVGPALLVFGLQGLHKETNMENAELRCTYNVTGKQQDATDM